MSKQPEKLVDQLDKRKHFLVGTQYFRPPTPRPRDWERDLAHIREQGMNIIRLWLVWSWMNPAPDTFDFQDVEKILALCKKNDIQAILLTSLEGAPNWLVRQHPECSYVSRWNIPRIPTSGANLTPGGFPGLCMDHSIVRELGAKFIAATARHFSGFDHIYGWEPQNEPMMEGARYHDEMYCYCPASIDRFQEWLRRKYETLEALQDAWRQKLSCWEDVAPPRSSGSWPDWVDWRNFAMDNICDHLHWRYNAIAENDPNHRILMHSRANTGVLLDVNTQCIDDWRLAKLVDTFGQAAFPGDYGDVDYPLSMEITRCSCRGKEWWQAELQGGGHGRGIERHLIIGGQRLMYWSWQAVALGAKAVLYWQYRPERMGFEYGYGLTNLDGSPSERTDAVKGMSAVLQKHAGLFNRAVPQKHEVAIAFTPTNYIIHGLSEGDHKTLGFVREGHYQDPATSMRGIYATLMARDLGADVVRADEDVVDDDLSDYKVLYLPCPAWISPQMARKIRDFVAAGGTVVSEASLAQYDEELLASIRVPGLGLDEVFGVERVEGRIINVEHAELKFGQITIPSRHYREVLQPKGAEVIGTHEDGSPAMTRHKYGRGMAYYIGSNPFMEYFHNPNQGLLAFVDQVNAQVAREVFTDRDETLARTLTCEGQRIVFLFNLRREPLKTTLTVTGESRPPTELLTNEAVPCVTAGKGVQITTDLEANGVRCYLFA